MPERASAAHTDAHASSSSSSSSAAFAASHEPTVRVSAEAKDVVEKLRAQCAQRLVRADRELSGFYARLEGDVARASGDGAS